jgi:hypothetical protein
MAPFTTPIDSVAQKTANAAAPARDAGAEGVRIVFHNGRAIPWGIGTAPDAFNLVPGSLAADRTLPDGKRL